MYHHNSRRHPDWKYPTWSTLTWDIEGSVALFVHHEEKRKEGYGLPRLNVGSFLDPSLWRSSMLRITSSLMLAITGFSSMMADRSVLVLAALD